MYQNVPILQSEPPHCVSSHASDPGNGSIHSPPATETVEATNKAHKHTYFSLEETPRVVSVSCRPDDANFTRNTELFIATSQTLPAAEASFKEREHVYFTLEVESGEGSSNLHPDNNSNREATGLSSNNNSNHLYFTLEQPGDTTVHQQSSAAYNEVAHKASSTSGGGERQVNRPYYPGGSNHSEMCEPDSCDYAEIDDEELPAIQEQRYSCKAAESATANKRPARKMPKAVAFIPSHDSVLSPVLFCHLDPQEDDDYPVTSTTSKNECEPTSSLTEGAANLHNAEEHDHDYAEVD